MDGAAELALYILLPFVLFFLFVRGGRLGDIAIVVVLGAAVYLLLHGLPGTASPTAKPPAATTEAVPGAGRRL
jgi:hypothetical protein